MELRKAKNEGQLDKALNTYKKFQLLTIDELGYLPIDPEGARLLFQVISNTYETSSLIITTNIPFSKWGTIFGDDNIAAAIIDRLIHHGRLLRHQGKSRRVTRPHAITTGRKKPCNMTDLNLTEHTCAEESTGPSHNHNKPSKPAIDPHYPPANTSAKHAPRKGTNPSPSRHRAEHSPHPDQQDRNRPLAPLRTTIPLPLMAQEP
mgnify:FL=1